MYKYLIIALLIVTSASCDRSKADYKRIITKEYPELYASIFERDGESLLNFTNNADSTVREQAWRALINTPVNDVDLLIDKVIEANSKSAWASLWFKELDSKQVERLQNLWQENEDARLGLASVLGQQGNENTLQLLLDTSLQGIANDLEFEIAYAIGLLSSKFEVTEENQYKLVERAMSNSSPQIGRAYLYGYYRTDKNLETEVEEELMRLWIAKSRNSLLDQYVFKILMANHSRKVLFLFDLEDYSRFGVQMAIEVAKTIATSPDNDHAVLVLSSLLDHRNPSVLVATLKTLQIKENYAEILNNVIRSKVIGFGEVEPIVRLEALNTIPDPADLEDMTRRLAGEEPYLLPLKYSILKKYSTSNDYFDMLKTDINSDNRFTRLFAMNEFANWWEGLDESEKTEVQVEQAKELLYENMQKADRSMVYGMSSLFMDEELLPNSDFGLITNMLKRFKLPEDVEVYQSIAQVCEIRFNDQAKPLIDSLAEIGNSALNKTFISQGWDIEEKDYPLTKFRTPDWKRLAKIGEHPVLKLETNKGVIGIQLDPLIAPATISGIDSLAKAGAYNNVAFHRVVQNFVVQGGDVETGDGFGGPNYVVPTEASATQYFRGKVGIASAGIDTEGSQYFVMHQWAPHLNGRYTIIGEVFTGMDVVDKIQVGDVVNRAVVIKN
ncbi:MAG: peptidylprolyl isomerase [Balneolaceae bacterium]